MPSNTKRKRKRPSDGNKTPAKRARKSKEETPKTPKTPTSAKKPNSKRRKSHKKHIKQSKDKKKKCHRPKSLRFIRAKVARALERALVEVPKVPLIYHLFTERDSMGTPRAPLHDVFRQLKISDFVKKTHLLRDTHLLSLTHFSTLFAIERDEGRLYLKYWPIYDKEAATVYVDNLPEGCNEEKLMRLAKCYGTVAELSIMKKNARWIRPQHHPRPNQRRNQNQNNPLIQPRRRVPPRKKPLINVGSRPRAFGFIRFVDADSADAMVKDFRYNDPSLRYERHEQQRQQELLAAEQDFLEFGPGDPEELAPPVVPQELPRQKPFKESFMMKLIYEIRYLKLRRKRRTYPMFMRLKRLRKRLREMRLREYTCLRKAGLMKRRPGLTYWERKKRQEKRQKKEAAAAKAARRSGGNKEPSAAQQLKRRLHNHKNATKAKKRRKERKEAREKAAEELAAARERGEVPGPSNAPELKGEESEGPFGDATANKKPEEKKKKKRKRKKMSRKLPQYIPGNQVRRFFIDTQVLSMRKYKELKAEYLELIRKEKERVREERDVPQIPDDI